MLCPELGLNWDLKLSFNVVQGTYKLQHKHTFNSLSNNTAIFRNAKHVKSFEDLYCRRSQ